jgi:hypothetical protein
MAKVGCWNRLIPRLSNLKFCNNNRSKKVDFFTKKKTKRALDLELYEDDLC